MTATLTMVPLAKIKARKGFNARTDFADEQMAELIESVRRHGIITPLTLAPDGDGRFVIIAGERRYRAAKLGEVPAEVREADGEALTLAVAENVIRADLNPVEEARAYRRLVDEHGDTAEVAALVGRSERLVAERLDLLRLPEGAQELLAARRVPLACAPGLVTIARGEALLADLAAAWLAERPHDAALFPADPGEFVDDVLRADWRDGDRQPLHRVAYSVSEFGSGPVLPASLRDEDAIAAVLAKLGRHAEKVAEALSALPEIAHASEYDWAARQAEARRWRDCFSLDHDDADAARAFGCLLEVPGRNGRSHAYVTDSEWLADRLVQKIAAHAAAERERRRRDRESCQGSNPEEDAEKEARRRERERQYEARISARARNLDLGAALARWQPKLGRRQAARLARADPLRQGRRLGAPAVRGAADDDEQAGEDDRPLPARRRGRARAARGGDRGIDAGEDARCGTGRRPPPPRRPAARRHRRPPERRPAGHLRAARTGRVESPRQTRRPRRPGVREEAPRGTGGRARAPGGGMPRGASGEAGRTARQARSGRAVRCECCFRPIDKLADAAEKHGALVHAGDCESQCGSASDDPDEAD